MDEKWNPGADWKTYPGPLCEHLRAAVGGAGGAIVVEVTSAGFDGGTEEGLGILPPFLGAEFSLCDTAKLSGRQTLDPIAVKSDHGPSLLARMTFKVLCATYST
jgi:hypothetical protein